MLYTPDIDLSSKQLTFAYCLGYVAATSMMVVILLSGEA